MIIAREDRLAGFEGKLILAHELAHTRQHDWLGPWYLPAHVVCELVSSLVATIKRAPVFSKVHAYNPLEQTFICIGAGACRPLAAGDIKTPFALSELLTAFAILRAPTPEARAAAFAALVADLRAARDAVLGELPTSTELLKPPSP